MNPEISKIDEVTRIGQLIGPFTMLINLHVLASWEHDDDEPYEPLTKLDMPDTKN